LVRFCTTRGKLLVSVAGLWHAVMLPRSISTRVLLAFGTVFLLALGLLAIGLIAAHDVNVESQQMKRLATMLRTEEEHDRLQQRLRLGIGDVTRRAEAGRPIAAASLTGLLSMLATFDRQAVASPSFVSPDLAMLLQEQAAAAHQFVLTGRALVRIAPREPAAIAARMPGFLTALRRLERARSNVRLRLVRDVDAAMLRHSGQVSAASLRILLGSAGLLTILMVLIVWLRRQVIEPIVRIADRLRQFNAGHDGVADVPGLSRRDELGDLARGLNEYRRAMQQRRQAERRADFLAHHDVLTGLANRLLFDERLAHELARAQRTAEKVAVFAIDLDDFKAINDRFGHAGGDAALVRAARLLTRCVRADDLVARLGGDEFAIIQVAAEQPRAAETLLSRLFDTFERTEAEDIPLRLSVGVAVSGDDHGLEELYNLADMAMYRAKSEGRHTARFFDDGLKEEVRLRWRLGHDLEGAIERGELHLCYQPIADAGTLRVHGYEALLRWTHPELGEISPDQFIPLAESSGGIVPIGLWVADQAMAAAAQWDERVSLALNLSPIQFRHERLADELLALAARHRIAPRRLEFEVTESATLLGTRREAVLTTLRALQSAGAQVVMDDFGTGHSSLGNLREFRFDKLKVDRSFVQSMVDHAPSASIVRSIVALGQSLSIPVVAEGVETSVQLQVLRGWGCDEVQGYLIGRPMAQPDVMVHGTSLYG